MPQEPNVTEVRAAGHERVIVFVHGFSGGRDDTWDLFPSLLGTATPDWDIFSIGYATTLLPDVVGIWSADPDLPILATLLRTQLMTPPFSTYKSIALVAHSMGGLVVQQALVDDPSLASRVTHVLLFGTPSGGLRKAHWAHFWKRQLKNMAIGSSFIKELRDGWRASYGAATPFSLLVVAGASDQFVPPASSLEPFPKAVQRVVPGNHLAIVKPANAKASSLLLALAALGHGAPPAPDPVAQLRLAAERSDPAASTLVAQVETTEMSAKQIVDAALALDRAGKRAESKALLERHQDKNVDIKGTYGGRIKREWLEDGQHETGMRALSLYQSALDAAVKPDDIYYLAINVAFMKFVFLDDVDGAKAMANLALKHAAPPGADVWKTATVAEANLYLGNKSEALKYYRLLITLEAERWKHESASLQASRIAAKLGDRDLAEALEVIFTPGARQVNKIFVSYNHDDKVWLDRLKVMLAPYLRAESELDLWDDTRLRAGDRWNQHIQTALAEAGVGVVLVSADFLASEYVVEHELPAMLAAARDGELRLLWVYISSAGWEETALRDFQATHDTSTPLDAFAKPQQNEILKSVARQIKEAALGATDNFKKHAS